MTYSQDITLAQYPDCYKERTLELYEERKSLMGVFDLQIPSEIRRFLAIYRDPKLNARVEGLDEHRYVLFIFPGGALELIK